MKETHFVTIDENIRVDIRFKLEKKEVVDFAINVSVVNEDKTEDVYRVDTKHVHLHEQKFWISEKPMDLEDDYSSYKKAFLTKKEEVRKNYKKWVENYENAKRKNRR